MPNSIQSKAYDVEYGKREGMCMPRDAVNLTFHPEHAWILQPHLEFWSQVAEGDRVLLIDDLVATGGTLSSGIELVTLGLRLR